MARKSAIPISTGTVFLIGAVAGFVIVPGRRHTYCPPVLDCTAPSNYSSVGWSRPVYDAALIGTWALLIVGALLVMVGLINYARR